MLSFDEEINILSTIVYEELVEYSEFLFKHHRLKEKLDSIEESWELSDKAEREERLNKLDKECADLLLYLEKKY